MVPEPLKKPDVTAFPVGKLAPFLRAVADPEGRGLSHEDAAAIRHIEQNLDARSRPGDGEEA